MYNIHQVSVRRQLDVGVVVSVRSPAGLRRVRVPRAPRPPPRALRTLRAPLRARAGQHARGVHVSILAYGLLGVYVGVISV